jgi:flagellar protein FlaJ
MKNLSGIATALFSWIPDSYPEVFLSVKSNLPKADMKISFRSYISTVFFVSFLVFLMSIPVLYITLQIIEIALFQRIIYLIFAPILIAFATFAILLFLPIQKSLTRRRSIETNLPFALTHMGAVAESGIQPYVIFKLIGEFEEYGELAKEMRKIVRNIDTFGLDPLTAIKEVAERTPSKELKQVLLGFVTTTESGGDTRTFLKNAGQQALFEWKINRERFLQQLSAYAEFYTGLLIAAPLFIIALLAVMNLISPNIGGFNILDLTKLSIYLVVPSVNIGFLLFLRGVEVEM